MSQRIQQTFFPRFGDHMFLGIHDQEDISALFNWTCLFWWLADKQSSGNMVRRKSVMMFCLITIMETALQRLPHHLLKWLLSNLWSGPTVRINRPGCWLVTKLFCSSCVHWLWVVWTVMGCSKMLCTVPKNKKWKEKKKEESLNEFTFPFFWSWIYSFSHCI